MYHTKWWARKKQITMKAWVWVSSMTLEMPTSLSFATHFVWSSRMFWDLQSNQITYTFCHQCEFNASSADSTASNE